MIGSLKGSVGCLATDYCIIETAGGVGYRVFMPAAHLAQLTQGWQRTFMCTRRCARTPLSCTAF